MSVLNKLWQIKNAERNTPLLKKLLANRGLSSETEIEHFFHPSAARDFHDPFLMKDMRLAIERICHAIDASERIMIFGDYDVDGITATAILMRTLTKLRANASYRLPHRIEDGYGLREKFVKEFHRLNVKVVITVDNGIACLREAELCRTHNIDLIITDHHTIPKELPNAFAILHPKLPDSGYPFGELTGAGVALKLSQALFMQRMEKNAACDEVRKLFDLACMGTIADLGQLRGENRYIVKEGLAVLENTRWPGLSRLKESAGIRGKINTHAIGFFLGPRINAAGRISHPSHALRLLLHDTPYTDVLAQNLERLNKKRQQLMDELMEIAEALALQQCNDSIIIISHPQFHGGVIGLLATKLSEKYFRPVIVMEERSETFIGSCRSIPQINIVEALTAAKDLFTHFGGHAAAAGFDLPKAHFPTFVEKIKAYVSSILHAEKCVPLLPIECEITHSDVSEKTVEMLRWFEPFGVNNEVPRFLCKNIPVRTYSTVGASNKHLKIHAVLNDSSIDCIGFRLGAFTDMLKNSQAIDAVCEIEENEWRGEKKLQLKIADFSPIAKN